MAILKISVVEEFGNEIFGRRASLLEITVKAEAPHELDDAVIFKC